MAKQSKVTNQMSREEYLEIVKPSWANGLQKEPEKRNKRVQNAKKIEKYGIKFDSHLELYCWEKLTGAGIKFEFQHKLILQPRFKYIGHIIRPITWTPDFFLEDLNMIIDSKGYSTDIAPLKIKMAKYYFHQQGKEIKIELPSTKKEVNKLVLEILYLNNTR